MNKQRRDTYVRQSKVDGYRARSAYKLIEIDEKFKIFKGGLSIVDIGAAPGSWSQYASKVVKSGKIISIDLKEMEPIPNTIQIKGDFTENEIQQEIIDYNNSLGEIKRMQVDPSQCYFLHLIIKISNIKNALEIGTFTGLSALSISLALPADGKLIALDKNEETNRVANSFFKKANQDHKIKTIIKH